MSERETEQTVAELASLLKSWQIDWEPQFKVTPWRPFRRLRRTGL